MKSAVLSMPPASQCARCAPTISWKHRCTTRTKRSPRKAGLCCADCSTRQTDLPPQPFADLLARINSPRVTVNYDIGNSAALGFDPAEEMACYGKQVSDIHIKDRKLGGGSVPLGTGDARFERFFQALEPLNYKGPFIMQAYRDDEGLQMFRTQLDWLRTNYPQVTQ